MPTKPSKKKRLNLRTKAASSKEENTDSEQKVQCDKETDSSGDNEKQPSLLVRTKLHDDHLHRKSDDSDERIASKATEEIGSSIKCCPVCKYDFTGVDSDFSNVSSDAEINDHINKCLDSKKSEMKPSSPCEVCQLCGKDISKYNTVRRQQHINRCCDKLEKTKPQVTSISCPICGKSFKTTKSRQAHMKKCAKDNNVSTHHLVELNRKENRNDPDLTDSSTSGQNNMTKQDTLSFVENNYRRKRKATLPSKNLDDDTQLALALSASMRSDSVDIGELGRRKGKKQKKENSELPALLLRSDDEMKKVTEARAAAILCEWADHDDEIQSTPALAPSSLVKKYGKESSSDTEELEAVLQQTEESDVEDITERCDSPVIEIRGTSRNKEKKCSCANELESLGIHAPQGEQSKQYFTIDTRSRLWRLASLQSDLITNNAFYVPNLLPKSTPRKKKPTRRSDSNTNEEQFHCVDTLEKDKDVHKDSPSKDSIHDDELTESQQKDIEELAELINDDNSDRLSFSDEKEQSEEFEKTWFPSSGFCVRKDMLEIGDQNKKEVNALLNDLSCMVGNPLRSDVEIIAKDNKFCAHSFMLSARCSTLAEILQSSEKCHKDGDSNSLIRLELPDIDVRAVGAVMTYIYTGNFIPIVKNVLDDVEKLLHRWNLNCDLDKWEVMRDRTSHDDNDDSDEYPNGNVENLDGLLKTLWEGEEEIISVKNEDENPFGDSILDDELGDMEIKIYTQVSPQKNMLLSEDCVVNFKDKARTIDFPCHNKHSNLEDEAVLETMDNVVCVPETPLKLSPTCSPDKNNTNKSLTEGDLTLVEEPMHGLVNTKTGQSSHFSDNMNSVTSFPPDHSSPIARKSDSDELGHLQSSPMSLSSPSFVEMLSSPERSPLPENLDDYGEYNSPNQAQTFSIQNSHNSPSSSPNKPTDDKWNIESCLNTCISVIASPESRNTSSSAHSTKIGDNVATANEDNIKETAQLSTFSDKGDSKCVDQASVIEPCRKRNKLPADKIEDDSLLDIFATSISDSKTEQSPMYISKQVDSSSSIDISTLSPKSILSSPALYSPNSKEEDMGMGINSEAKLKIDNDEENMSAHSSNTSRGAKQSLVFNSENQDISEEMYLTEENRCSSQSKDEIDFSQNGSRSHLNKTTSKVTEESTKSKTSEAMSSVEAQSDCQKDCFNRQFMTPRQVNKITTKQTCDPAGKADSWLDESSIKAVILSNRKDQDKGEENIYYNNDDDEYIDCFDDGGFNCDIEEYFTYDAYSGIEQDNVAPVDEEQGTSSLMNVEEETTNKHQSMRGEETKKQDNDIQTIANKKDKIIKDTKKRNNNAGGKTGKSKNEFASKQAKANDIPPKEFKLRDPRTPMLDYSNMATPELKVELKQYGVRPLAKRKMVVKLKEIYNFTHKETDSEIESDEDKNEKRSSKNVNEEVEPCSEDTNSQHGNTQDTESCSDSEQNWYEEELSDNDDDVLSQQSSSNLSNTLKSFLTQDNELYFKILKFMPISVADVLETIKENGIKCSVVQLKNFFDEQCITYSEPRPARVQKRGRRGKGKPTKV